ncbi:unnamed protein product, partial [Prunus brigantina]
MSVPEYEHKFNELSRFAPELIPTEEEKCRHFEKGLWLDIQAAVDGSEVMDLDLVVGDLGLGQLGVSILGSITFREEFRVLPSCLISAITTRRLLKSGYVGYLAHIIDTHEITLNLEDVLVVQEFPDVFSNDLHGLPPQRETMLTIELFSGMNPIYQAPYRMAPVELQELKT